MANFILSYTDILVSSHTLIEQLKSNMILYKGRKNKNKSKQCFNTQFSPILFADLFTVTIKHQDFTRINKYLSQGLSISKL